MDSKYAMQNENPEQLLDVFKAAALSVTRLYKSSVSAETRARAEGYQDCLDDLLSLLDKDGHSFSEPALSKLRKWAADRREGRDVSPQTFESEEETEKTEPTSTPVAMNTDSQQQPAVEPAPQPSHPPADEPRPPEFVVPTQDSFTFQSDHPYPNIELLDLSDARNHHPRPHRHRPGKSAPRASGHLGRGAGAKRRMDFDDFFGGCFNGKDPFSGGKRGRHS